MWGSALIGDEYDIPVEVDDIMTKSVLTALSQHPNFSSEDMPMETKSSLSTSNVYKSFSFPPNGDGWLESSIGRSADDLIRSLRKMRRHDKSQTDEIDGMIEDIRTLKALETQATIKSLSWSDEHDYAIRNLGLSDTNLKSLRKFGETRSSSLIQACEMYEKAESTLKQLDTHESAWGPEEEQAWATAMSDRSTAKKMWRTTLRQTDNLAKHQQNALEFAASELQTKGPLSSRRIVENGLEAGVLKNTQKEEITPASMSKLLKMYGEELDIYKGAQRGTFVKMDHTGLIIKDVWSYAAGFLDADGSIFITERGEPRASFVATGTRGRTHCEQMHKALGCGNLALDQRISKKSNRTTHRLMFNSKADIQKLLKGILPHLKMKGLQAKAVLEYIDNTDIARKSELKRLVTYENWKDDKRKASALLQDWGIGAEDLTKYAEGL
tara:strand:+ start:7088 stop:8407 length:1320 start_codon:yes stop_codon:yes gene_type:complete